MTPLEGLARERWVFASVLTTLMVGFYFGFILLIAFNRPLISTLLTEGLTLGILLGVLVIVAAWILTYIYISWANKVYDKKLHIIKGDLK